MLLYHADLADVLNPPHADQPRSEFNGRIVHGNNDDGSMLLINAKDNGAILDKSCRYPFAAYAPTLSSAQRYDMDSNDRRLFLQRADKLFGLRERDLKP